MPSRKEAPNIITLEQRDSVRTAIVFGDIEGAILKINDLAPKLLMDNTRLHFKLMIQQIIELIRNRWVGEIVKFQQSLYQNWKCALLIFIGFICNAK